MTTILVLTKQQLTHLKELPYEIINKSELTVTIKVQFDRPTDLFYAGLSIGLEIAYQESLSVGLHQLSLLKKDTSNPSGTKAEAHQGREGNQQESK